MQVANGVQTPFPTPARPCRLHASGPKARDVGGFEPQRSRLLPQCRQGAPYSYRITFGRREVQGNPQGCHVGPVKPCWTACTGCVLTW